MRTVLRAEVAVSALVAVACHEHSYGLINVVTGTQIREREGKPPAGGVANRPAD